MSIPIIIAELAGNTATALGITARGHTPVLALCRKLVGQGNAAASSMRVYRNGVACLHIRSIGKAAELRVTDDTNGRPVFRNHHPRR